MIFHTPAPKSKKRKPNAKARALQASWEDLLKKYDVKPNVVVAQRTSSPPVVLRRDSMAHLPSVDTGVGVAPKKETPVYTGDAMIGISVLHKSNGIPVFRQEDAIDISKMRR
jgi:hypothetical protein